MSQSLAMYMYYYVQGLGCNKLPKCDWPRWARRSIFFRKPFCRRVPTTIQLPHLHVACDAGVVQANASMYT